MKKYTQHRLKELDISNKENQCTKFATFSPYYYGVLDREFANISGEKMDKHHKYEAFRKAIDEDNILIKYSTIWGGQLLEKTDGFPKRVERLRFHPEHLGINADGKSMKYKSAKASNVHPFLNGLYTYYIKPLQAQGLTEQQIIKKLKPTFQKITITEGEFKAFTGCKHGLPVIGTVGNHSAVKTIKTNKGKYDVTTGANFLPEITEFIETFGVQEIDFLLDSDCFDNVENSDRAKQFYASVRNFWYACISAKVQMNFRYIKSDANGKGLDDIILSGADLDDSIVTIPIRCKTDIEKIEFSFATSVKDNPFFFSNNYESIKARKGAKLSEVTTTSFILNSIAIAPTGTGKTFLTSKHSNWKVLACPTNALCDNVASDYHALKFDSKNVLQFAKAIEQFEVMNLVCTLAGGTPSKFITVTYDSLRKLTAYLSRVVGQFDLFIDESQNYTTATSKNYKLKALSDVIGITEQYKSVTLLTGTYLPCFHPAIATMPIREIISPKRRIDATLYECKNTLKAVEKLIKKSLDAGRFPLVLLNSKQLDGKLGVLLGYLKGLGISHFNGNTKDNKDWKEITSKGNINALIRGMIFTTVLKEGNNIHNNYDFDLIVVGNFHSAEIAQVAARARNPKSITLSIIKSENRTLYNSDRSLYKIATDLLYTAMSSNFELNTKDIDYDLLLTEFKARNYISNLPLKMIDNRCEIDYLLLSNFAFQFDAVQENRNDVLLRDRLNKYNIKLSKDIQELSYDTSKEEKEITKLSKKEVTARKEKEFETLYQELRTKEIFSYASKQLTYSANQLSPVEKSTFKKIQSVSNTITNKSFVLQMLKDSGLSDSKFNQLKKQYVIYSLYNNTDFMKSQRKFSIVLDTIYNTFETGVNITAQDIRTELIKCLSVDSGLNLDKLAKGDPKVTNKAAMKKIKLFFNIDDKKVNGVRFKVLKPVIWNDLMNNSTEPVTKEVELNEDGYPAFWG